MVVPFVDPGRLSSWASSRATEATARWWQAMHSLAAKLYYRNVSWREMGKIAYDSAIPHQRRCVFLLRGRLDLPST